MNIGIVTTWFERGAAYVSRAYLETLSIKHDVFIYARGGERYAKGEEKWDKDYVTWGKVSYNNDKAKIDFEDFKRWICNKKINIVIFNEQNNWEIILQIKDLDILIGAYIDYYTPDTVPFFLLYDFLLCNTKRHYSVFKNNPQVLYIPWGTDLKNFNFLNRESSRESIVFFHSSGMNPYRKGTDILVKAFKKTKGEAKLVIHLQKANSLDKSILKIVKADPRISIIEKEVGAPGLYHMGDVYVYPSRLDGIGLTIAEALASGLPVITTNTPPMNEFIQEGVNGRVTRVKEYLKRRDNYYWPMAICSEESLYENLKFYIDNYEKIYIYKLWAREYAEINLNWQKNSQILLDFVEEIVCKRARHDSELIKKVSKYEWKKRQRSRLVCIMSRFISLFSRMIRQIRCFFRI